MLIISLFSQEKIFKINRFQLKELFLNFPRRKYLNYIDPSFDEFRFPRHKIVKYNRFYKKYEHLYIGRLLILVPKFHGI